MAKLDDDDSTPDVTCAAATIANDGCMYSLVVITDWEVFTSFVYRTDDIEQDGEVIYEHDGWLTGMWVSERNKIYLVDTDGQVHTISNGESSIVQTSAAGPLNGVFGLSDELVFACGDGGVLLGCDGAKWTAIDTPTDKNLYRISASSGGNVYIVGEKGIAIKYDGQGCRRIDLATNVMLNAVLVTDEEHTYIVSESGLLFVGSNDSWSSIRADKNIGLFAVEQYAGKIILGAGGDGIFCLQDGEIEEYKTNVPAYGITANKELLAVRANNFAVKHDGKTWKGKTYDP